MRSLLLASALLLAPSALAATLRPATTLEGPTVRVADLFDDAGPVAARVLGPSPAPGARIVVESAQLAAIARQFGVDWRPAGPQDRAVLDRPGRLLPREAVLSALRAALGNLGADGDLEIDLPGFAAPMVPPGIAIETTVEQLDWDAGSGRFTGQLALSGEGMAMQRIRLSGSAQELVALPVPVRRLNPGAVIQPEDLHLVRLRAGQARGEVVRAAQDAVGMTLRRQLAPGVPLALADLTRTPIVVKGARVTMELRAGGLALAAPGLALEPGVQGERIRVVNPSSRAVVEAEITGPDRVRVLPGSVPVTLPAGRMAQLIPNGRTVQ